MPLIAPSGLTEPEKYSTLIQIGISGISLLYSILISVNIIKCYWNRKYTIKFSFLSYISSVLFSNTLLFGIIPSGNQIAIFFLFSLTPVLLLMISSGIVFPRVGSLLVKIFRLEFMFMLVGKIAFREKFQKSYQIFGIWKPNKRFELGKLLFFVGLALLILVALNVAMAAAPRTKDGLFMPPGYNEKTLGYNGPTEVVDFEVGSDLIVPTTAGEKFQLLGAATQFTNVPKLYFVASLKNIENKSAFAFTINPFGSTSQNLIWDTTTSGNEGQIEWGIDAGSYQYERPGLDLLDPFIVKMIPTGTYHAYLIMNGQYIAQTDYSVTIQK
ncbi:MAG: hypothetical protein ACYDBJ_11025 [Aggregatilineales bacterium]